MFAVGENAVAGSRPRISVVIVSYHTGPVLKTCVDSVVEQLGDNDLIIVDNGNDAESSAFLRTGAARGLFKLRTGHGNVGFAAGCNIGAREANGKYLLLLNPDCILPANALCSFDEIACRLDRDFVLGARILDPDGVEQRGSRRATLTPLNALIEGLGLGGKWRYGQLYLHHQPLGTGDVFDVPVVSGACLLTQAATYWRIGGMDEGYFLHVEDIDFCFRAARSGVRVMFCPEIEVRHVKGTSAASRLFVEWHKAKGFARYFVRHFTLSWWLPLVPLVCFGGILRFAIGAAVRSRRGR